MVLGTVVLPPNSYGRDQDTSLRCLCSEASGPALPNLTGRIQRGELGRWRITVIKCAWGFPKLVLSTTLPSSSFAREVSCGYFFSWCFTVFTEKKNK